MCTSVFFVFREGRRRHHIPSVLLMGTEPGSSAGVTSSLPASVLSPSKLLLKLLFHCFRCMSALPLSEEAEDSVGFPGNEVTDGWLSTAMWMLGTELWTSRSAVSAHNCCAVSSGPHFFLSFFSFFSLKNT